MPADGSIRSVAPLKAGEYQPNHPEVLAEIADFSNDRAAWEHDNVIPCAGCETRFYVGFPGDVSMFDDDIRTFDGVFVCEDCAPAYVEEATYDPIREHGTWSI